MKMRYIYISTMLVATVFTSCHKDLDLAPANSTNAEAQYSTALGYKQALAKVYGSYSLISSTGVGNSDVYQPGLGGDQAPTDFIRGYWNMQELTTDEAVCAWNDPNLQSYHNFSWTSSNPLITAVYARCLFQITVCNEFIRESSDAKIAARGFTGAEATDIKHYRAEARFLRAYQYWVLADLFGNPPFVTEKDPIGKYIPPQIKRADLFNYIETELKEIDPELVAPRSNEYARADQAAAWALLARLYLNAETYIGTPKYTEAITYASKVIGAGYTLLDNYSNLFKSDNNLNNNEVILAIAYDAERSQNYGGTTFLINSAHANNDLTDLNDFGIPKGGWLGNRATKNLPMTFGDYTGNTDKRALFKSSGNIEVGSVLNFSNGLEVHKFSNITSDGLIPSSPNGVLANTDFPLFRLAEMYLTYIEAVKRGGTGGNTITALSYFNGLRYRAYGNTSGNVGSNYTLDDILNERQRELYWECFRRTDLIRFGKFTSSTYLWPWKGSVADGTGVDDHYKLFPIPSADRISNTNLKQNDGY
ncbi:RagB/SusD family nutrient uptake outer membrane protein [Ferruginibacter sp. SUN002]|uniref:RagB/SusD family nutrient uptake outer membrane protein n=1 Tax=Ferruginibacter sp. SUN002 TaxID=2937789 RepID=UPI003D362D32